MQLDRRLFLKSSGALALCGLSPRVLFAIEARAAASSATQARRKTLVVFFLRGGVDGLNLVVPHGDGAYYDLRPSLAIPRPGASRGAIDLGGFFGLHPRGGALEPLFREGTAVALHAVGYPKNSRSHFLEQDVWETGQAENTRSTDGWLNRHLQTSSGHGPIRAVALGGGLPRVLRGEARALAVRGLGELAAGGSADATTLQALRAAYRTGDGGGSARGLLGREGSTAIGALEELAAVAGRPYRSDATYPDTDLGRRCRDAARMIRADVGLEVVELDYGGWDTHQNQGRVDGTFGNHVGNLSGSIAALCRDLEDRLDDVLVLTLSEFGRTAAQNGTGGTDHGWGNCLLAIGGPVRRAGGGAPRNVLGEWPGLAREQLHQRRDLAHTTDFRDVLAEVTSSFLENPSPEQVLPGHEPRPLGVV